MQIVSTYRPWVVVASLGVDLAPPGCPILWDFKQVFLILFISNGPKGQLGVITFPYCLSMKWTACLFTEWIIHVRMNFSKNPSADAWGHREHDILLFAHSHSHNLTSVRPSAHSPSDWSRLSHAICITHDPPDWCQRHSDKQVCPL